MGGLQPALGNLLLAALDSLPVVGSFEGIGHVVEYTLRIVEDGTRQVEAAEHLALADNLHIVVGSLQVVVGEALAEVQNPQGEQNHQSCPFSESHSCLSFYYLL